VIVEKHIEGDDHRMLVVGGKLLVSTRRVPGGVTGDGASTVAQLIQQVNTDPRRGTGKRNLLISLALDDEARGCLTEHGLAADGVPEMGRFVCLRRTRKEIELAMYRLNHRPRKCLGYRTPHEVFMEQLQLHNQSVALQT